MVSRHKRKRIFVFRSGVLALFLSLLIIKIFANSFLNDDFIRSYVGDVLAIPLVYCFLATFLVCPRIVPFVLFLLATVVEIGQLFHLFGDPGNGTMINLLFGGTFDPLDLLSYILGALSVDIVRSIYHKRRVKARVQASQHRRMRHINE